MFVQDFFLNLCSSDFRQDGQTNDQNCQGRSPGLPPGGLEHPPGGREGGQEQVSHLQAGQEGQGDGGGEGNGEKTRGGRRNLATLADVNKLIRIVQQSPSSPLRVS